MKKLCERTKEYLHIVGKYDGGRCYTWKMAHDDLEYLAVAVYDLYRSRRIDDVTRHLASLLYHEIQDEIRRTWSLHCKNILQNALQEEKPADEF